MPEKTRIRVTDNMIIIDNIAIPRVNVPPKEYPDEVFSDDIQEAMEYYQSYRSFAANQNIEPLTPQAYLMTILLKVGRTGTLRDQILRDWAKHYGIQNMIRLFGGSEEDIKMFPSPEQELMSMLAKNP